MKRKNPVERSVAPSPTRGKETGKNLPLHTCTSQRKAYD